MAKYIYGRNAVSHALQSGRVEILYLASENNSFPYIEFQNKHHFDVRFLNRAKLDALVSCEKHQGVVALVHEYHFYSLAEMLKAKTEKSLVLILDEISDPHNYGAILRSADAYGVDFVIVKNRNQAPISGVVEKSSAGAMNYVRIVEVGNLNQTIMALKENGYWVVGTALDGATPLPDFDFDANIALVLGSEGDGISSLVKKNCDVLLKIPMQGHVGSLNVSVSAGICLAFIRYLQNS